MKKHKIKDDLELILPILSLSTLSKTHFNKSRQWLYQKINESTVNGVKYKFDDNEINILISALEGIDKDINEAIRRLRSHIRTNNRQHAKYYTNGNPFKHPLFRDWLDLIPNYDTKRYLEPFAGSNNIVNLVRQVDNNIANWNCFDVAPPIINNAPDYAVVKRDTIKNFPKGFNICITNPPYLSKNSATRNKLRYPDTQYNDLYKYCIDIMLRNCEYVAAIIPESFVTSQLFHSRLYGVVSLNNKLFNDTHCPVCLALFTPSKRDTDFIVYIGDDYIGKYRELKKHDLSEYLNGSNWKFNNPDGEIGIKCVDNHKEADIYFHRGDLIFSDKIKISSRTFTRISGLPYDINIDDFIYTCNRILDNYRENTHDVFLTSFKGLREDKRYRRRIDFKIIRCILNKALIQFE